VIARTVGLLTLALAMLAVAAGALHALFFTGFAEAIAR
jgi:hypothetical protein